VNPSMIEQYQRRMLAKRLAKLQQRFNAGELSINGVRSALGLQTFPALECDARALPLTGGNMVSGNE
jgi:hypothetical protein